MGHVNAPVEVGTGLNAELICRGNIYLNGGFIEMKTGEMMKQLTVSDCTILKARWTSPA